MKDLRLKKGREKSIALRHPWVFSGALQDRPDHGTGVCRICDHQGKPLATGYYNSKSQIIARILSFNPSQDLNSVDFWRQTLARAIAKRQEISNAPGTDGYRLVYSEADHLPGLIVDRFGEVLVVQILTLGLQPYKEIIYDLLLELTGQTKIFAMVDPKATKWEGIPPETSGFRRGEASGTVVIQQHGRKFRVDLHEGQKTGFYLDQRENHSLFGEYCGPNQTVLDAFCYSGGFALAAAEAGSTAITVLDQSAQALELVQQNLATNGHYPDLEVIHGDAFEKLRNLHKDERQFDVVSLDPPKFAAKAADVNKAAKGYKDINRLGFSLTKNGGYLFTYSCSGHINRDLFQKIIFAASNEAGKDVEVIQNLRQSRDHPELLTVPESFYLKGFLCRVWDR